MAKEDFYDTLGIAQTSSADEIKKAYRKKAMQYHPDRNQGDDAAEQKFKEINEAYDVLKDDQKRAAYDQFGHSAFDGSGGGGGNSSSNDVAAAARAVAKSLLAQERWGNDLGVWRAFGQAEANVGNVKEAQKILDAAMMTP